MASTFQWALCFGMLALCLAAPAKKITWCANSENELKKCKELAKNCGTPQISLSCTNKGSTEECLKAIAKGDADAVTLDSGYIYKAARNPYKLKPILAENYGTEKEADTCYYVVALVKQSSSFVFSDLKGKKSCHTGVGRAAGWVSPVGNLLATGQIQWKGPEEQSAEKVVSGFFSGACAPGASDIKLCQQCAGQGENKCKATDKEPYYGYSGARQCLKDGKGDVAFGKHIIPVEFHKDYELLCLNDTRKPITDYKNCYWDKIPAHAVVTRGAKPDENTIQAITEFLQNAQKKTECKLFESAYGKDLLFKDSATGFRPLPAKMDAFLYLGSKLVKTLDALTKVLEPQSNDKIRWCTQSKDEKRKCDDWSIFSNGAIECVEASLAEECITKVMKGEADAASLDGGYLYTAGECGLVPAMGEIYDAEECKNDRSDTPGSYYAVAVGKKSNKDLSWDNLKDKKTCHTAVGRTAGWNVPVGLINKKTGVCDMAKYFKQSCAPGADVNSNLCKLCVGDPQDKLDNTKCSANNKELYYGYTGALRCLLDKGDVAFVKETTVFETFSGSNIPDWAKDVTIDQLELLCLDGTRRPVTEYKNCHLAKVPAHAVVTTQEKKAAVVKILKDQEANFGRNKPRSSQWQMFSSEGHKDQLFKDSTQCLREIKGDSMADYLGTEYIDALSGLNKCSNSKSDLLAACTFHTCKI